MGSLLNSLVANPSAFSVFYFITALNFHHSLVCEYINPINFDLRTRVHRLFFLFRFV